jgi:hypothetical protein
LGITGRLTMIAVTGTASDISGINDGYRERRRW